MKKRSQNRRFILAITISLLFAVVARGQMVDIENGVVIIPNIFERFTTKEGTDGRIVAFPKDWNTTTGLDGRLIAYPPSGWFTASGMDGRKIAYPIGWATASGLDGRKIAYPFGWATASGLDDRKIAYPFGWATASGLDDRKIAYPFGWATASGLDDRKIAYPFGWTTASGSDGRKIAFPFGWNSTSGEDGRKIGFPYGWIQKEGADGRKVAFPAGWNSKEGSGGRRVCYPNYADSFFVLIFPEANKLAILAELEDELSAIEFCYYALYCFINDEDDRIEELKSKANVGTQSADYIGTGGGHWIQEVMEGGKYIILEDNSLWEISSLDRIYTGIWLPISNIAVIYTGDYYPYTLVNTDDNESAQARYLGTK
jgi:hypothetical protein